MSFFTIQGETMSLPSDCNGESLRRRCTRTKSFWFESSRIEDIDKLITGGERPRIGSICNEEHSQGRQVNILVISRREESPVEVS
jgi:hypothetical protein